MAIRTYRVGGMKHQPSASDKGAERKLMRVKQSIVVAI